MGSAKNDLPYTLFDALLHFGVDQDPDLDPRIHASD
jgi:hypothetical protein